MKYSNELKVGLVVVISAVVLILGVRFMMDLPLFDRTVSYYTTFDNASGLVSGNPVRVDGVRVGSVERVRYNPELRQVQVSFYVDPSIIITEGSHTQISGMPMIGDVRMNIELGPAENPPIEPGGFVQSHEEDHLATIIDRAPEMISRVDTTIMRLESTLAGFSQLVEDPEGDLRQAIRSIGGGADAVSRVLNEEQHRMARTLDSLAQLTGSINAVVAANQDTLSQAISGLNRVVTQMDRNLAEIESTTQRMNSLLEHVENGEGTIGLLLQDPSLYHQIDSTANRLNTLIDDFQDNPRRYLRELRLLNFF